MSKTNKWGSVYVLLSVNATAKKNIFIWNNVSRFIMCLIILCVLLVVSEVIFLSSQSNWDWFQLSGQLIPLLPAHCCLRLLGFHSCCLHQDWDCCWNYTTYIFFYGNEYKKEENSLRMFGEVELSVVLNSVSWDFGNACHTHCLPELHSLVPVAEKSLCSWTRIIRHEKSCSGTWNLRGKTCWH